jgi:hypothetical protein
LLFSACYMMLELFAIADLSNWWEMNWLSWYKTSVCISIHVILVAECAQDPVLLSGNVTWHDDSYDVNSTVEASD